MKQQTFSDIEYSHRRKKTKREEFLEAMDQIIPWQHWIDLIKDYYPSGKRGRPPRGIETMLRMYLMQNWFNLSDAAIEDAMPGGSKETYCNRQVTIRNIVYFRGFLTKLRYYMISTSCYLS